MVDRTDRQFHCGQSADGAHWQCKALGLKISIDATLHAYVHGQVKKKKKDASKGGDTASVLEAEARDRDSGARVLVATGPLKLGGRMAGPARIIINYL